MGYARFPQWLHILSIASIVLGAVCSAAIVVDEFRRPQKMWIVNVVWPVTALFGTIIWLAAYFAWGRNAPPGEDEDKTTAFPVMVMKGSSHCGAGCTLGDVVGAWLVFALGWQLLGLALPAEYVADFALAFGLGVVFQFFSIAPMRGLGLRDGLAAALKADTLSLVAFEIGLFAWMAVMQLVLFRHPHLAPDHAAYWFLMQVGMAVGFLTAYPANAWLVGRGIKEAM